MLTAREVAAELRCSVPLVYKLAREGHLPATRISVSPRPALRWLAADVVDYLNRINSERTP